MADRSPTLPGVRNRAIVRALAAFIFLAFGVLDLVVGHVPLGVVFLVIAAVLVADAVRKQREGEGGPGTTR